VLPQIKQLQEILAQNAELTARLKLSDEHNRRLQQENERLTAPVSREEIEKYDCASCSGKMHSACLHPLAVNELIASRATQPAPQSTENER